MKLVMTWLDWILVCLWKVCNGEHDMFGWWWIDM